MGKVIKVRSWRDLPEVVEPGTYVVGGVKVKVVRPLSRDGLRMIIKGVREAEARGWD